MHGFLARLVAMIKAVDPIGGSASRNTKFKGWDGNNGAVLPLFFFNFFLVYLLQQANGRLPGLPLEGLALRGVIAEGQVRGGDHAPVG